jgi:hypothetical protein
MPVVKESWKVIAGMLLGLAGAAAIITAWFRVRDLLEVADQVPILVSGGMGGLALLVGGVWLLRSHESDLLFRHLRETTERLERVEEDVARLAQLFDGARVEIDIPEVEVSA